MALLRARCEVPRAGASCLVGLVHQYPSFVARRSHCLFCSLLLNDYLHCVEEVVLHLSHFPGLFNGITNTRFMFQVHRSSIYFSSRISSQQDHQRPGRFLIEECE